MSFLPATKADRRDGWKYVTYRTGVRHLTVGGALVAATFAFSLARKLAGAPNGLDAVPQVLWVYLAAIAGAAVFAVALSRSYIRWNDERIEFHRVWAESFSIRLDDVVGMSKGLNGSVSLKVARANNILISRFADGVLELVEELSRRLSASGLKH